MCAGINQLLDIENFDRIRVSWCGGFGAESDTVEDFWEN